MDQKVVPFMNSPLFLPCLEFLKQCVSIAANKTLVFFFINLQNTVKLIQF